MTLAEAVEFIKQTNGRFFTVEFVKRTSNTVRVMTCRTGVKAGLAGGEAAYDPVQHGLIWVWEVGSEQRKSIPVEGIRRIKKGGEWFPVTRPQDSNARGG